MRTFEFGASRLVGAAILVVFGLRLLLGVRIEKSALIFSG